MTDTSHLTERQLAAWIGGGEHQRQDFKYKITDSAKLARTISAFANTDGGRLLIGVRDDGVLCGVRSEEEIYMVYRAAQEFCQPAPQVDFTTVVAAGRTIVIAQVDHLMTLRPVRAHDEKGRLRAYIRIDDENIVASPVHLRMWRDMASDKDVWMHYTDKEKGVLAALEVEKGSTLQQVVRKSGAGRYAVIKILSRLIRYRLARWWFDGHQFLFAQV